MTSLPKAGEINEIYLEYLERVVEGWRVGGRGVEGADHVVLVRVSSLFSFSRF